MYYILTSNRFNSNDQEKCRKASSGFVYFLLNFRDATSVHEEIDIRIIPTWKRSFDKNRESLGLSERKISVNN